jgi:hypothetical protein
MRRSRVQKCKGGCKLGVGVGVGAGVGKHSEFQVSGLGRREPGAGTQVRVQAQDLSFAPYPHLYLITRTRDLRAETWDPKTSPTFAPSLAYPHPYPCPYPYHFVFPLPSLWEQ